MVVDENGNNRVTLALIGQKLDMLSDSIEEVRRDVAILRECSVRQDELNKAVRNQLWGLDGRSRIQQAEEMADSAITWLRLAILPISLAIITSILSWCLR